MKNNLFTLIICLILSLAISFGLPMIFSSEVNGDSFLAQTVSKVSQKAVKSETSNLYHKIYYRGELIGVVNNIDDFNSYINDYYSLYEDEYPMTSLGLISDVFIVDEYSYFNFENKDSEIVDYLHNNGLIGIKASAIEFSTSEGVYDIIYVSNIDYFNSAQKRFLANFISDSALEKLNNGETISSPSSFETKDMYVKIQEKMTISDAVVKPEQIFKSEDEVYQYFCYGRDTELEYYTTVEGDTLQAVGYLFGDMSAKQVMMLNQDKIFSEDQILQVGTKLNITYFKSPITVVVTKQRLAQEIVLPQSPIYKEDESLLQGNRDILVEEQNGLRNVLYEETWTNGVITSGKVLNSITISEPVQGVIAVGALVPPDVGTLNWGWPVNNPIITCNYTCYYGHGGVDFQNMYNRYDVVLAMDNGTVEEVGYTDIGGYYVMINHNNGYKTYYGHMRSRAYVRVGDVVQRGDAIGPIGMTGVATGPHVHLMMYVNGVRKDPCSILSCNLLY